MKEVLSLIYDGMREDEETTKNKTVFLKKREKAKIIYERWTICMRLICKELKIYYYAFHENVFQGEALLAHS